MEAKEKSEAQKKEKNKFPISDAYSY